MGAGPNIGMVARLATEKGVEVLEEAPVVRMGATGFGRSIYTRDPDGYMVEFKEEVAE